jgi:hypothetical protein
MLLVASTQSLLLWRRILASKLKAENFFGADLS